MDDSTVLETTPNGISGSFVLGDPFDDNVASSFDRCLLVGDFGSNESGGTRFYIFAFLRHDDFGEGL